MNNNEYQGDNVAKKCFWRVVGLQKMIAKKLI